MAERRAEHVGYGVYIEILKMIATTSANAHEIEKETGWTRRPILRFLRIIVRMELAHVESWTRPPGSRCRVERFLLGPGVNAPRPPVRGGKNGREHMQDKTFRSQGLAIGNLLRALSEGATRAELVECSGISVRSMGKLIPQMTDYPRLAHIVDWKRRQGWGGPPDPIYLLGNKRHADRPKPEGAGISNRRYRNKVAIRQGRSDGYSVFAGLAQASILSVA